MASASQKFVTSTEVASSHGSCLNPSEAAASMVSEWTREFLIISYSGMADNVCPP
jgi:hypothetical protein